MRAATTWKRCSARAAPRRGVSVSATSCARERRFGHSQSRNACDACASIDCGHPESDTTSGLVAYLDREPVGWCAVEPRPEYEGLLRVFRVPWEGRDEDKTDDAVWAVTCLFVRAGFRKRGVSRALARAAVGFARERGAGALEAYPIIPKNVISEELHVGTPSVFADAGLVEVNRPTLRRVVMRLDF
jgi:GNAT superfamily N-acetyltransferase